jgi:hypothetical protein
VLAVDGEMSNTMKQNPNVKLEGFGITLQLSEVAELDPPNLEEGMDEDGIIDDCDIETYYNALEDLLVGNGYLRVIGDGGFTNVEIRIPFKHLEALGWHKV